MKSPLSNFLRCDGLHRRDFLHSGLLTAFGMSTAGLLRAHSAPTESQRSRAQSCILIWLDGGPTHLDTFDPKPDAPIEVRGPFGTLATPVPGIHLSEHLPKTARCMKDIALVRSLTHELGNHDTGTHYLLTGYRPSPVLKFPSLGSMVAYETGMERTLPPYITIPSSKPAGGPGFLPAACSPFDVGGDPSKPDYRVRDLSAPEWLSIDRLADRKRLLQQVESFARASESLHEGTLDPHFEQAYRLIAGSDARQAFDLSSEDARTRDRYGRRKLGTGCLMARRLVEAGTRFVTVVDPGWDSHQDIARNLPDTRFAGSGKLPDLDQAYSALLEDLRQRGLLESTLVVLMGEFGRTPKINAQGGRDHWPRAGFVAFAGGGTRGGQVIGATDEHGETPSDKPIRPEDVAASVLTLLGVDPRREVHTPTGRPIRWQPTGDMIPGLI